MSHSNLATLDQIRSLLAAQEYQKALQLASALKTTRHLLPELDYLRSMAFLGLSRPHEAHEAAKEGLRFFPDDEKCLELLKEIKVCIASQTQRFDSEEFDMLLDLVRPYTMVGAERLYSLYNLAKKVCKEDIDGDFVECGVAAGGSSALLAAVIQRHSKRPRICWSCDTFEGMPDPEPCDSHFGVGANDTGWGAGTCAAPVESLQKVAAEVGVSQLIRPIQGLFNETLPKLRGRLQQIAFLHADGDWYKSTMDIFTNLYDLIPEGGIIQIDDYGFWQGCQQAVREFADSRSIIFALHQIDNTGVWLQKKTNSSPLPLLPTSWDLPSRKPDKLQLAQSNGYAKLNVGCGSCFHADWINLDIVPRHGSVIQHDLKRELPFSDNSFHVVYNSHVLEHLQRRNGRLFIRECYRVLRGRGILRVVVPDLEAISKLYLKYLDAAEEGDEVGHQRYEWIILELLDQLVRESRGGDMLQYFKQHPMPAEEFVIERLGEEVRQTLRFLRSQPENLSIQKECNDGAQEDFMNAESLYQFRESGELHKWMYDRHSLRCLLESEGFIDIKLLEAWQSSIPNFANYHLDCMPDGSVRKPDSLFMEAIKP